MKTVEKKNGGGVNGGNGNGSNAGGGPAGLPTIKEILRRQQADSEVVKVLVKS